MLSIKFEAKLNLQRRHRHSYMAIANSSILPFRPDGASWRQSELQGEGVPPQHGRHHELPELLPHLLLSLEIFGKVTKSPPGATLLGSLRQVF